jgi:transcriptional regulator with XRE-family HTH domain
MSKKDSPLVIFLKDLMRLRKCLPSHLAAELGVSHAAVSRWLSGEDSPNIKSYRKLAEYSGVSLEEMLVIAGYIPSAAGTKKVHLPEFREYANQKYPHELDEDIIVMIEDLIARRRARKHHRGKS